MSTFVWKQTGLVYGDWESGPTGDSTYIHHHILTATQVSSALMADLILYMPDKLYW